MIRGCSHMLQRLISCQSFGQCPLRFILCLRQSDLRVLVPREKNPYIPPRVNYLFLSWTSIASSNFHFRAFFMTKLSPMQGTLRLPIILSNGALITNPSQRTNISSTTKAHGCNESHVVFHELGLPKGEHTYTFLIAFLSCWLCLFTLLVRYPRCIGLSTFLVASNMERSQAFVFLLPSS
ncbi:hypothetical protein Cgig2_034106 [Carnegiea gigantea]|uniref:Uncharacterized protein n=1 Tax=Carnegiea gigantea TaxID=171969 RepID=A0A9Q1K313_9CARY|nr:hypothetical protein Cgig2_034106 [Carnegiea gigantea]